MPRKPQGSRPKKIDGPRLDPKLRRLFEDGVPPADDPFLEFDSLTLLPIWGRWRDEILREWHRAGRPGVPWGEQHLTPDLARLDEMAGESS